MMYRRQWIVGLLFAALLGCAHAQPAPVRCKSDDGVVSVRLSGDGPNPRYLALNTPAGWRYLNYPPAGAQLTPYTADTHTLTLELATQKAVRYVDGQRETVKAFAQPGDYRLVFADNTETEPENTQGFACAVRVEA